MKFPIINTWHCTQCEFLFYTNLDDEPRHCPKCNCTELEDSKMWELKEIDLKGGGKVKEYRNRKPQVIEAEIDYIMNELSKKRDELARLENKLNFLNSELRFSLKVSPIKE